MALYSNYPNTNFHELNLDWLIEQMKALAEAWENFNGRVDATAFPSVDPSVTVTGDLQNGLTFTFGLPMGAPGTPGAPGVGIVSATVSAAGDFSLTLSDGTVLSLGNIKGPQGTPGQGLVIIATLSSASDLPATGNAGDAYMVENGAVYDLYIWDTVALDWANVGSMSSPSPSSATPLMDGTATAGSSSAFSRGDHVHPVDTSRQAKIADTITIDGSATPVAGTKNLVTQFKTIESNVITGIGDITLANIGAQDALVTSGHGVQINSVATPVNDDVNLATVSSISSINSQSLLTGTNLPLSAIGAQPTLVSGTNIKTINGASILTSGNIFVPTVYSGSGDPDAGTGVNGDLYIKLS